MSLGMRATCRYMYVYIRVDLTIPCSEGAEYRAVEQSAVCGDSDFKTVFESDFEHSLSEAILLR